jgi:peptide/nickel transport system permease protein
MRGFALRRLASGVVLVFAVTVATHAMLYAGGGDIARKLLGETASPEIVARKRLELGLDRSWFEQYREWLTSFLRGDLGRSWRSGQQVTDSIVDRLDVTLSLVFATVLLTAVLATVLGVVAARRGGWVDSVIQVLSVLGLAIPGFLIALWLVVVFAVQLGWFRATGFTPIGESFPDWVRSVTLPVIALSIGAIAAVAQQVRGSILDQLGRDYVRTLRSRGLPLNRVLYRHVLRNASGPALAILGLQFIVLLGGAVFVEQIFALPGIGQLTITSALASDIPVVMGLVVWMAVIVVVVNLMIDLAQGALNPKVRRS